MDAHARATPSTTKARVVEWALVAIFATLVVLKVAGVLAGELTLMGRFPVWLVAGVLECLAAALIASRWRPRLTMGVVIVLAGGVLAYLNIVGPKGLAKIDTACGCFGPVRATFVTRLVLASAIVCLASVRLMLSRNSTSQFRTG